ncbi:glycosyltransferase [Pseudomonas sp.]|uniref:glycosyltransferase n=1 Tax=Pseudomonas sp. TaxID=306 RepID=UPI0029070B5C|nr:glycosyltransferase [Pseudomonas sp.]MDU4250140.1 glycosyltransferase [Pseudomonas sp.]
MMDLLILIGSKISQDTIHSSLGKPEYSYYFLMKEFVPALQRLGSVVEVKSLEEVDALYDRHSAQGRQVVFLSFSPPQQTPEGLRCPTIPVFAWEFDSIPVEAWGDEPRNDWRHVFAGSGSAITLSREAADAVKAVMGDDYPIIALPAPVWDRFQGQEMAGTRGLNLSERLLRFSGHLIDSPYLGLSADCLVLPPKVDPGASPVPNIPLSPGKVRWLTSKALFKGWWCEAVRPFLPRPGKDVQAAPAGTSLQEAPASQQVALRGVVYTTVLNPGDHRKNWIDMISAFCWAFHDVADATLVVKMTHHDLESYRVMLMTLLSRLAPFQCRIVVIHGFLEDEEYRDLVRHSTYYVNTSVCEGLCLPLMEFLSCGKPAIGPRHTAMLDYLDDEVAFIVGSAPQPASWPHDSRALLRAYLHRLNWESLVAAYRSSYETAKRPADYQRMSYAAERKMRGYCSVEQVSSRLGAFLDSQRRAGSVEKRSLVS